MIMVQKHRIKQRLQNCKVIEQDNDELPNIQEIAEMLPLSEELQKVQINDDLSNIQETTVKKVEANKKKKPTKSTIEKMPKLSIRFDHIDHLPDFDKSDERLGYRCKLEGCGKQTTVFCTKCKVHLCIVPGKSNRGRNCFKKFHILKEN